MQVPDFTIEHLKKLPLRAIVAFAARCARRVEHLAQLPERNPQRESRRAAVEAALCVAEAYATGSDDPPDESALAAIEAARGASDSPAGSEDATVAAAEAANAAESAWRLTGYREAGRDKALEPKTAEARKFLGGLATVTADLAALSAFTAAVDAFVSVGYHNEDFVAAARNDYDTLVRLRLGNYPEAGAPVDPSPCGPLGRL
jgi:hypothetical protein